jgi:putative heme-binding domain-containing protein
MEILLVCSVSRVPYFHGGCMIPIASKKWLPHLSLWMAMALASAGPLLAQQHNLSAADLENGARIYNANCFACHGQNGDLVAGVDLRRGFFRHVSTDDELARVVLNGVPGTAMPPNRLTPQELQGVVAYVRSLKNSQAGAIQLGDPRRGQLLAEGKGACLNCHQINGKGSHIAPDLSEEGMLRNPAFLQNVLTDSKAMAQPRNRFIRAVTSDGETITGRRLNEDTDTVQIIDSNERLRSISKADLREYTVQKETAMPSYRDKFTNRELSDVVAYLVSLKGGQR